MWDPTAPRLITNMTKTTKEDQESALTLFQDIAPVVFHLCAPAFSPTVLTKGAKWHALPTRTDTSHTSPALTETAAPDPATLVAVRSGKIISNCARPKNGQTASPSLPVDPYSGITSVASVGGGDGDSDYVESAKISPMRPDNVLDHEGHNIELEEMHEVAEGELDAIAQPKVISSHTNEIEIMELADDETDPPENHQDNGAMLPVNTQPYLPHLPPEDTSVDSAEPLPRPCVESRDAALQAQE